MDEVALDEGEHRRLENLGVCLGPIEVLAGDLALNVAAVGLGLISIGSVIIGCASLLGRVGLAVGPILFLVFANPIAGAAIPKEFLPDPWGQIGQWFPPGAEATLIRDVSFFPAADPTFSWLVLSAWTLLGAVLMIVAGIRRRIRAAKRAHTVE